MGEEGFDLNPALDLAAKEGNRPRLVSLEQHEALATSTTLNALASKPNGIACPTCGAELFDTFPWRTLSTNPPRTNIHCDGCSFIGTRIR